MLQNFKLSNRLPLYFLRIIFTLVFLFYTGTATAVNPSQEPSTSTQMPDELLTDDELTDRMPFMLLVSPEEHQNEQTKGQIQKYVDDKYSDINMSDSSNNTSIYHKSKFNIIPLDSLLIQSNFTEKIKNAFSRISQDNWDNSLLKSIYLHGNPQDIRYIKRFIQQDVFNKLKNKIIESLLAKVYLSQTIKGGNYSPDKDSVKLLEEQGGGKLLRKIKPREKVIDFQTSEGIRRVEGIQVTYQNLEDVRNDFQIYTEALVKLLSYYHARNTPPKEIKQSFISLLQIVDKEPSFAELFQEYTKIIQSIDRDTLEYFNNKKEFFSKNSIALPQILIGFFLRIGDLQNAIYYLNVSESLIHNAQHNNGLFADLDKNNTTLEKLVTHHHWNIGVIKIREEKYKEAEEHMLYVYNQNQEDKECVEHLFDIYRKLGNKEKAWKMIERHKNLLPCMRVIKEIIYNKKHPTYEDIKNFPYRDRSSILMTALKQAISFNDIEHTDSYRRMLSNDIIENKSLFRKLEDIWRITAKLLYSERNIFDKNLQDHLNKLSVAQKTKLLYDMSILYATPTTYDISLKYVEVALESDLHNYWLRKQKEKLEEAIRSEDERKQYEHEQAVQERMLSSHKTEEEHPPIDQREKGKEVPRREGSSLLTKTIDSDVHQEDPYEEIYNPQSIHQYFQNYKREMLKQSINLSETHETGWLIDENTPIKSSKTIRTEIYSVYAAIDPRLEVELGDDIEKWRETLKKGFTHRKKGISGIKYLRNQTFAAKIVTENHRLISTRTYVNDEGKTLILFDKKLSHNEISRYIDNHPQKEIRCPNVI